MEFREKMIMAVMIIVAVCMLLGCTVTTTFPTTFHVTNGDLVVPGVIVSVGDESNTTDETGTAILNLTSGTHDYAANDGIHTMTIGTVTVPATGVVNVALESNRATR